LSHRLVPDHARGAWPDFERFLDSRLPAERPAGRLEAGARDGLGVYVRGGIEREGVGRPARLGYDLASVSDAKS
jgi:hypothetical protein